MRARRSVHVSPAPLPASGAGGPRDGGADGGGCAAAAAPPVPATLRFEAAECAPARRGGAAGRARGGPAGAAPGAEGGVRLGRLPSGDPGVEGAPLGDAGRGGGGDDDDEGDDEDLAGILSEELAAGGGRVPADMPGVAASLRASRPRAKAAADRDPLLWFTGMPPRALRRAQARFVHALPVVAQLASLRATAILASRRAE